VVRAARAEPTDRRRDARCHGADHVAVVVGGPRHGIVGQTTPGADGRVV